MADVVSSVLLAEQHAHVGIAALVQQLEMMGAIVDAHGGVMVEQAGDGSNSVFARASDAVAAALDSQLALQAKEWGDLGDLQVRMALHTGEAAPIDGHYYNVTLYRCGTLLKLTHGGQILLTRATAELVIDALPARTTLRSLGDYALTPVSRPQRVMQLVHPDIRLVFPPLQTLRVPANLQVLTAREREIVDLLALGYSNKHIAETLVVASSTVERHVANVLSKLDLHSRAQIAAWAAVAASHVRQESKAPSRS